MQPPRGHAGSPSVLPWAEPALAAEDCEGVAGGRPQLLETVARSVAKGQFHGVGIVTSQRRTCLTQPRPRGYPERGGEPLRKEGPGGERAPCASLLRWDPASHPQSGLLSGAKPPAPGRPCPCGFLPPLSCPPPPFFFFFLNFKVPICFLFGGRVLQHEPKR